MQLKKTQAASYMEWGEFKRAVSTLIEHKEYRFSAIIAAGTYCALRISDLRDFTWKDFKTSDVTVSEEKREKVRTITIHPTLKKILIRCQKALNAQDHEPLCANKTGTPMSTQYINTQLKYLLIKNGFKVEGEKLNGKGISTHMFRKTLAREIWKRNDYSEQSIVLISKMLNHADVATTRIYLGITDDEIKQLYLSVD